MTTKTTFEIEINENIIAADVTFYRDRSEDGGYRYVIESFYMGNEDTGEISVLGKGDDFIEELGEEGHEKLDDEINEFAYRGLCSGKI